MLAKGPGAKLEPVEAHTRATAIRIGNPASWRKAARVVEETGGWCIDVSEAEIAIAKAELGAEGLGCEPASAVTLAGLKKLRAKSLIDFHRGTLLHEDEKVGVEQRIEPLRRNAVSMDADPAAVLAAMKDASA
jgi:threonine synthase